MNKRRKYGIGILLGLWIAMGGSTAWSQQLCGVDELFVKGPAHGVRTHLQTAPMIASTSPEGATESFRQVQAMPPAHSEVVDVDWLMDIIDSNVAFVELGIEDPASVSLIVVDAFRTTDGIYRHGDYVADLLDRFMAAVGEPWASAVSIRYANYWPDLTTQNIADVLAAELAEVSGRVVVLLNFEILACFLEMRGGSFDLRSLSENEDVTSLLPLIEEEVGNEDLIGLAYADIENAIDEAARQFEESREDPLGMFLNDLEDIMTERDVGEFIVVAPAGNWAVRKDLPSAPAVLDGVLSVSANIDGQRYATSWMYPDASVDRLALMTSNPGDVMHPGGWYAFGDHNEYVGDDHLAGTSFSAPMIAALAALSLGAGDIDAEMFMTELAACSAAEGVGFWYLPRVLEGDCS